MINSISRQTRYLLFILTICFVVTTLAHGAPRLKSNGQPQREYTYQLPKKIDDGWKISSLVEEGVDPKQITDLMLAILTEKYKNIHSVLLVKNGNLILE